VRLFIAIEISDEIRRKLDSFLDELRGVAPQVKWVRAANLHVTLKFLGNTDAARVSEIAGALQSIRSPQPVSLEFRELGFFPNEQRPKVFWAGLTSSPNLPALAADIDRAMHPFGFPLEARSFTPHLTLARFDPPGLPSNLGGILKQHASDNFGSLSARGFHLIESKLKSTGAEYTTIHSFRFLTEN
jgi:RNA 2',3'-cyclic 3'-phosphodiesterase